MRLYEFADPTKYLLPETDAEDLAEQTGFTRTTDKTEVVAPQLRKKPEANKHANTL